MDDINAMMGNLNLQGGNDGLMNMNLHDQNFDYGDGGNFNPLLETYFPSNDSNPNHKNMEMNLPMSNKNKAFFNNPQLGLDSDLQGNTFPSWDDSMMSNMNMPNPMGPMSMNTANSNQNFQPEKGRKIIQRKNNNNNNVKPANPNQKFNQNFNNAFDPMSMQNPQLYNAYYNNNPMNNIPPSAQGQQGKKNNNNMMNFGYPNNNAMPFDLMNLGMQGIGMGLNLPNFAMNPMNMNMNMNLNAGMNGMNVMSGGGFGNAGNMNAHGINHKQHRNKRDNNGHFQKKETAEPPSTEEIIAKAVEFSKDHSGSRLVQKRYEEASEEERNKIFEKLKPEILSLSKDVFGNYAIQKVLEMKDEIKNKFILDALKTKIYDLSLHMYGCRVIQQLLTVIDDQYVPDITEELAPYFAKCIEDQNGNHVIQKIIERLHPGEDNGIFGVVLNDIYNLSMHQYGCRVIQKLFNQCNEQQKNELLEGIYQRIIDLCQDQYGNYVIQYVLEKQKGENVQRIYNDLQGRIYEMSIHKFGSNVIEKALSYGSPEQQAGIIDEIISKDDQVHDSLLSMVKDKYGNYVVQKMIEYSDQTTKENIIKRIISSQSLKKRDGFCKLIIYIMYIHS